MSKLKHTPGPWVIGSWGIHTPHLIKAFDILIEDANEDAGIAHVQRRYTKEQTEANARLVAAAPEMLESLIEVYKAIYTGETYIDDDRMQNIIEKATGMSIEEILK